MSGRLGALFLAIWLAGGGCKKGQSEVPPVPVGGGSLVATDLRSAMFLTYPEFRGATITQARASVTRRLRVAPEASEGFLDRVRSEAAARGFALLDAGEGDFAATRPPYLLSTTPEPDGVWSIAVEVPLTNADFGKLLQSPAAMTTEQMSSLLPKLPEQPILSSQFRFEFRYAASPSRKNFLVRQLIHGLLATGWTSSSLPSAFDPRAVDAGPPLLPAEFLVELSQTHTGGKIRVALAEGEVHVDYLQPLATRTP